MRKDTEEKMYDASFAVHRASSLLTSLEDELSEDQLMSAVRTEMLHVSIASKLDGISDAQHLGVLESIRSDGRNEGIMKEIREREHQINIQQALAAIAIQNTLDKLEADKAKADRSRAVTLEEFFRKSQAELLEAKDQIEHQRAVIHRYEKERKEGKAGARGGVMMPMQSPAHYASDAVGPTPSAKLVFVAGVVKGPNLTQMWRRDCNTMYDAYHKASELNLHLANQHGGWVASHGCLQ
eukprot:Rhum_TRINITY_DN22946_c0_g1::Rhum_TRINITY_DN22946_c0_g1_i1::g.176427::m.176427